MMAKGFSTASSQGLGLGEALILQEVGLLPENLVSPEVVQLMELEIQEGILDRRDAFGNVGVGDMEHVRHVLCFILV